MMVFVPTRLGKFQFGKNFLKRESPTLNQQEQVLIYEHLIDLCYFSNNLNYLVYIFNLSTLDLSTLDYLFYQSNC